MKDELFQLFQQNISLINMIDKIIFYFHTQNYDQALRKSTIFIDQLNNNMSLMNSIAGQERVEMLASYLSNAFQAQSCQDYVLLSDLYELQIRQFFLELQENIIGSGNLTSSDICRESNLEITYQKYPEWGRLLCEGASLDSLTDQGYEIEFSSCGLMTLAMTDKNGRYYLHNNNRVSEAAFALANSWYEEDVSSYVVYGLGLGYHINELFDMDSEVNIEVFESDINMIKLAAAYTDFGNMISKPSVKIIYDPDFDKLLSRISQIKENEKFVIHYPSLRNIKNLVIKDKLEDYFIQYSSIENQRRLMNANFKNNIHNFDGFIDELKNAFKEKDLYIVAAGPSLDKNYLELKNVGENSIILATGTVYHKLITAGIKPDYVIVSDANERVLYQIWGQDTSGVVLLFLSTAYKGFAKYYHGRKYMICQKGYDKAETFANEHKAMLFQTGGSVSTTALDIGISFGCKRIIFLGLDLAYTDNYVHASETSRRNLPDTENLRQIKDIIGNNIYTSRSLDIYRNWIEKRINGVKDIEFIDATEGGAKINGMKIMKLSKCIINK